MTAEQILSGLGKAYADCQTYCDSGCVRTRFLRPDGREDFDSIKPFETAFVRPGRFRFEYASHHPKRSEFHRYIVYMAGAVVQTWWDIRPGVERHPSLSRALSGATGVSGGTAHTVPALLMPEQIGGWRLTDLVGVVRLPDEELEGVECYRLQGQFELDPAQSERFRQETVRFTGSRPAVVAPKLLWVEKQTLLVRRVEVAHQFEDFRTESVTDYEPTFDVPVPEDHLRFDPPT